MVIDYRMYNNEKLTTQVAKNIKMYSNNLSEKTKTIKNVVIKRIDIDFTYQNVKVIQLLEVLENYKRIENLDQRMFMTFIQEKISYFNNQRFHCIYSKKRYKKSTIALLKQILESNGIESNISKYLSQTSKDQIKR